MMPNIEASIGESRMGNQATEQASPKRTTAGMGGFAKGLAVIEAFGEGRELLSIADVSRLTGLDRATARRCLLTLVELGYAEIDNRQYRLTPRILRLGHTYLSASLPQLLQPTLEKVSSILHESCSCSVLDGTEIVYISRASYNRIMSIGLSPGSRLPAYCTSMGRAILSQLPTERAREILEGSEPKSFTRNTLTEVSDIMDRLAEVRRDGYAIVDQELEIGLRSLAVPIVSRANGTVFAMNVGVQASRVSIAQLRSEYLPALEKAREELMQILP